MFKNAKAQIRLVVEKISPKEIWTADLPKFTI